MLDPLSAFDRLTACGQKRAVVIVDISNSQGSNSSNSSSGSGKTLSLAEYTRRMRSTDAEWAAQARAAGLHLRPSPEVVVEEEEENEDDIYSLAELEGENEDEDESTLSPSYGLSPNLLMHDQDAPTMDFAEEVEEEEDDDHDDDGAAGVRYDDRTPIERHLPVSSSTGKVLLYRTLSEFERMHAQRYRRTQKRQESHIASLEDELARLREQLEHVHQQTCASHRAFDCCSLCGPDVCLVKKSRR